MPDAFLNESPFRSLAHARHLITAWINYGTTARPHSAFGYQTPAGFALHLTTVTGSGRGRSRGRSRSRMKDRWQSITASRMILGPVSKVRKRGIVVHIGRLADHHLPPQAMVL